MTPRDIVKQFVDTHWDDQKIAEVFAFNQDGNPLGHYLLEDFAEEEESAIKQSRAVGGNRRRG